MSDKVVPIKFVKTLLFFIANQGFDVNDVLAGAGFDFNPLDTYSDVDEVSTLLYSQLYQQVMLLQQDESFGLLASGVRPLGTFRMMCYCLINCTTLKQAMLRAADFDAIILANRQGGSLNRRRVLSYEDDGKVALFSYQTHLNVDDVPRDRYLVGVASALSMWHRFCSWLIDHQIELDGVTFCGEAPDTLEKYQHFFNCKLHFGEPLNALKFSAEYLDFPILQNEESLRQFLRNAPYQLMVMPNHGDSIVSQIRSIIGHDFSRKFPSFEQLTETLNMSATTLRRRLRKEGTTYQQIKDNLRREAAIGYLNRPELTISGVSALMGFNDSSSFHRSFKKWTGLTPKDFREGKGIINIQEPDRDYDLG